MEDSTNALDNPLWNDILSQPQLFAPLLQWSQISFAHLPWRHNRTFYATLISEFMLQQTTVSGVRDKYIHFMQKYPSWDILRNVTLEKLLEAWKGLGYYQRPKSLYKLLQLYPSLDDLQSDCIAGLKQPGIGPYTQGALLSIGLDRPATACDANIRRVLSRFFHCSPLAIAEPYQILLRNQSPRALNEALMDLGREVCQARKVACESCLLNAHCLSRSTIQNTLTLQKQNAVAAERPELYLMRLIIMAPDGSTLGWKKPDKSWLSGYIELPTFLLPNIIPYDRNVLKQYPMMDLQAFQACAPHTELIQITYVTKYRLHSKILTIDRDDCSTQDLQWLEQTIEACEYFPKHALWTHNALAAIEAAQKKDETTLLL